jgi:lysylphosphatidylglycerol synthetase-like protein (DUF2156 family)
MREMAGLFGWIGVFGYGVALLNFFMKYINRKYINKVSKDKQAFAKVYRTIMKFIVKYHKIAGIIASISIVLHFYLMYNYRRLSISGIIAAVIMWSVFTLGIYGFGINKNMRGSWVKIHRILSFVLILLIAFHIMF